MSCSSCKYLNEENKKMVPFAVAAIIVLRKNAMSMVQIVIVKIMKLLM